MSRTETSKPRVSMNRIAILKNVVQEYTWGSTTFLPELQGKDVSEGRPQAELWMGVHPKGASMVLWDGAWILLSDLLAIDPKGLLGKSVAQQVLQRIALSFQGPGGSQPPLHPGPSRPGAGTRGVFQRTPSQIVTEFAPPKLSGSEPQT